MESSEREFKLKVRKYFQCKDVLDNRDSTTRDYVKASDTLRTTEYEIRKDLQKFTREEMESLPFRYQRPHPVEKCDCETCREASGRSQIE